MLRRGSARCRGSSPVARSRCSRRRGCTVRRWGQCWTRRTCNFRSLWAADRVVCQSGRAGGRSLCGRAHFRGCCSWRRARTGTRSRQSRGRSRSRRSSLSCLHTRGHRKTDTARPAAGRRTAVGAVSAAVAAGHAVPAQAHVLADGAEAVGRAGRAVGARAGRVRAQLRVRARKLLSAGERTGGRGGWLAGRCSTLRVLGTVHPVLPSRAV
jgi:hypothetical protein